MKIILTGVETNNKGAELMLYAILQEIERKFPEAEVYISRWNAKQGLSYVKTTVNLRYLPYEKILRISHINSILKRIRLPMIDATCFVKSDYFFDGSGFLFSDQTNLWGTTPQHWETVLKNQKNAGSRIVFLPQAFGPLEQEKTKQTIGILSKYSSLIMPREQISYNYLKESHLVDMNKVKLYTDFTSLVEGTFPGKYEHLRNGICIIPSRNMIYSKKISSESYLRLLSAIIAENRKSGRPVYLLNHEGAEDEAVCKMCKESINEGIELVTNLNALEVKGLISSAYLLVTSRYHGLASGLNSCVPSLATSWSHKYGELFKDYDMSEHVLPLDNVEKAVEAVKNLMDEKENLRMREHLQSVLPHIKQQTREMWDTIWSL